MTEEYLKNSIEHYKREVEICTNYALQLSDGYKKQFYDKLINEYEAHILDLENMLKILPIIS